MKLDVGRADNVDNDQLRAHVWRGGMRAGVETSIGEIEFRQPVRRRRMSPCLHATGYGLPLDGHECTCPRDRLSVSTGAPRMLGARARCVHPRACAVRSRSVDRPAHR